MTINPAQYDAILGLTITSGYIANPSHKMDKYFQSYFQLLAIPTASNTFTYDAFINEWDKMYSIPYPGLLIDSGTATTLSLDITSVSVSGTTYQTANPTTNVIDGRPFVCAVFENATWKCGIWLNGYFNSGIWECGNWVNGFLLDSSFGLNTY